MLLVAWVCLPPSLDAGIIYIAGTETVGPGGTVNVPITVSSSLTGGSVYWLNAGFNLTWSSGVLSLESVSLNGTPITALTSGNFNSWAGELYFSWTDFNGDNGYQVPNGSTLFTVSFTAVGGAGSSTPVDFSSVANIGLDNSSTNGFTFVIPSYENGSVGILPEPVNWALGLFGCLFIGGATMRWISRLGRMGSGGSQRGDGENEGRKD